MSADHYFLGDSALYARLCLFTEVLGNFVSRAPRDISLEQLEQLTGRPAKELTRLCAALCREGLLRVHPERSASWLLACEASKVTLEDAFRCVVTEQAARSRSTRKQTGGAEPVQREVSLLVTQAAMGINQSVFQHLRQFSLDRLKVGTASMFGARRSSDLPLKSWPPVHLSFS